MLFLLTGFLLMSQTDSVPMKGTIKVGRVKNERVFIRAFVRYRYELSNKQANMASDYTVFQPLPIVEGHAFPFNYSKYFKEKFKNEKVNLNGKPADTVNIEVKVTPKGKVYLYSKPTGKNETLNLQCLEFLKQIKQWQPAYVIIPEKRKFKDQSVIEPKKINVSATGIITVIFATESFDD